MRHLPADFVSHLPKQAIKCRLLHEENDDASSSCSQSMPPEFGRWLWQISERSNEFQVKRLGYRNDLNIYQADLIHIKSGYSLEHVLEKAIAGEPLPSLDFEIEEPVSPTQLPENRILHLRDIGNLEDFHNLQVTNNEFTLNPEIQG